MTINVPTLIPRPFASDQILTRPIPDTTATPGAASWTLGFPAITIEQSIGAGGMPPAGVDFNGALRNITQHTVHLESGGRYKWSAELVTLHGGYRQGDIIQSDDGLSEYVSLINNNTGNFNVTPSLIGVTWQAVSGQAAQAAIELISTTGGTIVLTASQIQARYIQITGALASPVTLTFPSITPAHGTWTVENLTTGPHALSVTYIGGTPINVSQGAVAAVSRIGNQIVHVTGDSPTQPLGTRSSKIASTEFVGDEIDDAIQTLPLGQNIYYRGSFIEGRQFTRLAGPQTLIAGTVYNSDTTSGPFTVMLPANPADGDYVYFVDVGLVWLANPMLINGNGKNIDGDADLSCNVEGLEFGLMYYATHNEWRIVVTQSLSNLITNIIATDTAIQSNVGIAGEALLANDVAVYRSTDGLIYPYAAAGSIGDSFRPMLETNPSGQNWLVSPAVTTTLSGTQQATSPLSFRAAQLTNGSYAVVYATTSNNLAFSILNPEGAVIVAPTDVIAIAGTAYPIELTALTGGGFAVVAVASSGAVVHYVISNTGVVGTQRSFDSPNLSTGNANTLAICPLLTGGYAVMANMLTGAKYTPKVATYDATGVQVLAPISLGTPAAGGAVHIGTANRCAQLSGGNLMVTFDLDTGLGNGSQKISVYNPAGAQQGTTFTAAGINGIFTSSACPYVTGTGLVAVSAGGDTIWLNNVSSTGAVTQNAYAVSAANAHLMGRCVPISDTRIAFPWRGGSTANGLNVAVVTDANVVAASITNGSIGTGANMPRLFKIANGQFGYLDGVTTTANIRFYDGSGATIVSAGPTIAVASSASADGTRPFFNQFPGAPAWAINYTVISVAPAALVAATRCLTERGSMSPLGIVTANTAQGVAVQAQVTGVAQTRLQFPVTLNVVSKTAVIPGINARFVGNKAVMVDSLVPPKNYGLLGIISGAATLTFIAPIDINLTICYSNPAGAPGTLLFNGVVVITYTGATQEPGVARREIFPIQAGTTITMSVTGPMIADAYAVQLINNV